MTKGPAPIFVQSPGRSAFFGVLAAGALFVAACGGPPSNGVASGGLTRTRSSSPAAQAVMAGGAVRFANCMRSHGVTNYPDPRSGGGAQSINQIDPNSSSFLTAYTACQKYAPHSELGPPTPSATQLRYALGFAHCLRKHGFPQFPDPLTAVPVQPNFTLGRGMYFPVNGTYDVQSLAFVRAAKACGAQLP